MAIAHKCDICGLLYEGEHTIQIAVGKSPTTLVDPVVRYDVCPDCYVSFRWWMDSRNPSRITVFEDKEDQ